MALVIANKPTKLASMKRLLPFLLLLVSSATLAESGAYRIEVIIFRNLLVATDTPLAEDLRSFSQFPGLEKSQPPDDLQVVTEKSTHMDGVWRRLRSSQGYRPLVYAAWEQNRVDYYPPMRIHNQQIIDTQLRPPTQIIVADLAAEDPLAAYRSNFYQIDGSVQLRRSRFLHLVLNLEYREKLPQTEPVPDFFTTNEFKAGNGSETDISSSHGVFALKQNRQIRTGQMQYFDTPYLGALVFVSAIPAK